MPPRLTSIELFAGGGGASDGIRAAGFHGQLAIDNNPDCVMTLAANGHTARLADLAQPVDFGDVLPPDLLWSSPPCQLHSRANSRRRHEAFDGWPATLAVIERLRPKAVIIENVKAAYDVMCRWQAALKPLGYTWTDVRVYDAADFGVPQHRNRSILIAFHEDVRDPPAFTDGPQMCARRRNLLDAIPYLADAPVDGRCRVTGEIVYSRGYGRAGSEPHRLYLPAPTVMTTEGKGTRASAITNWTFNGGPDRAADAAFLAVGRRRLTPDECAALQGFAPGRKFVGNKESVYRQIGNAVPPPMAEALASYVAEALLR
jgi:DNA (cytosine-5)-methyltransferase 1